MLDYPQLPSLRPRFIALSAPPYWVLSSDELAGPEIFLPVFLSSFLFFFLLCSFRMDFFLTCHLLARRPVSASLNLLFSPGTSVFARLAAPPPYTFFFSPVGPPVGEDEFQLRSLQLISDRLQLRLSPFLSASNQPPPCTTYQNFVVGMQQPPSFF